MVVSAIWQFDQTKVRERQRSVKFTAKYKKHLSRVQMKGLQSIWELLHTACAGIIVNFLVCIN